MRSLRLGVLASIGVVALGSAARAIGPGPGGADLPERLVPSLIAVACLCVAGLTIVRAPTAAWFAIALASSIGAVELIAVARAWAPAADGRSWAAATVVTAAATIAAATIATAYAASARRERSVAGIVLAIGVIGLVLVAIGQAWVLGASLADLDRVGEATDVGPIRAATRIALATIAVVAVIGVGRDLVPPWRRAWRRRAGGEAAGEARAAGASRTSLLRLYVEELVPTIAASRRDAAERERARLAADLHATVVPELRTALAAAGADPRPDAVRERLRSTLDGVESLMAERHSAVLEEFGLAAALEWLAERTETRTGSTVTLDLEGSDARPPRAVERAAFRVALLALDNAARHATAPISVRSAIHGDALEVVVQDAGPGIDPGAADTAAAAGRRGLADMRSEATSVNARLDVASVPEPSATGTRVTFRWPER